MSESNTKGTYPAGFTLLDFDALIQFFQEFGGFLIITNLEELYSDLRWVKGVNPSFSGVGDARWIKYLVSGECIFLEEIGSLDDPFFWAIGWFAKGSTSTCTQSGRQGNLQAAPSVITMKYLFFTPRRPARVDTSFR